MPAYPPTATTLRDVRHWLEQREDGLSPHAARSARSRGRERPEEPSPIRTEFQRDRDRIIHANSFRRLKHKTQVFIAPQGDHYVTRLTHTLEVSQIARTIARALNLNEDLTEAISLAHDLGHAPFGHAGEEALAQLFPDGFRHNEHSLRVVQVLEKGGRGLNLTWEVRDGVLHHSKAREGILVGSSDGASTLEGQASRLAGSVAYINHDLADALRAGVIGQDEIPPEVLSVLGERHSQRVNTLVTHIVEASWDVRSEAPSKQTPRVTMEGKVLQAADTLREFLFRRVYTSSLPRQDAELARHVVAGLYHHFADHPEDVPEEVALPGETPERQAADYVAGMTDGYALRWARWLKLADTEHISAILERNV